MYPSQNHAKNPSFSSTLLDNIYRSIDHPTADMNLYSQTTPTKQRKELAAAANKATERPHKYHHHHNHNHNDAPLYSSTSSDSSSGVLSSSDTESLRSRVSCFAPSRPRPKPNPKSVITSEGLIKSKSRALKIYNNLKKVKQPISPGGRLSTFLNSLFATKKTKTTYDDDAAAKARQADSSTCSSASSFSRSCLSKPSSDKLRDGVKRTVRFYPLTVIVDEDCRPCGHKCLYENDTRLMPTTTWKVALQQKPLHATTRRDDPASATDFFKDYRRTQNNADFVFRDFSHHHHHHHHHDDDDDDDAASYSSSDLFELDHLSVMGNTRYREELPVYETTHLSTNRAIANGLI